MHKLLFSTTAQTESPKFCVARYLEAACATYLRTSTRRSRSFFFFSRQRLAASRFCCFLFSFLCEGGPGYCCNTTRTSIAYRSNGTRASTAYHCNGTRTRTTYRSNWTHTKNDTYEYVQLVYLPLGQQATLNATLHITIISD